jgi:hypothetical protein
MNRLARSLVVSLIVAAAAPALAEELPRLQLTPPALVPADQGGGAGEGGRGSVLSGRTIGNGADAIHAQFGWPGIGITYLHGADHNLDFGGSFTFNYGYEGVPVINPGLKLAGVIRLNLVDGGKVNFGLRFDPGISMYFGNNYSRYFNDSGFQFGLALPVSLAFGIPIGDAVMINFGLDVPMTIFLTPDAVFELPFLFGGGVEYHVDSHLSLTANTGFGPDVFIRNGSYTEFNFKVLMGVAYRF